MINEPVSYVLPCLNEEKTLGKVLADINSVAPKLSAGYEIIVSDNGSTDRSVEIAKQAGARVEPASLRGYGAALQNGIEKAQNPIVIFADADATYDFTQSPELIQKLIHEQYDMVLGDRLNGHIQQGAMPFLHRYVGTPVLSALISVLIAGNSKAIKDCNSGFRVFRKNKFQSWNVKSTGMEFASEMLIKAIKSQAKIGWVPITLRKDVRGRVPHLRTWRDGMRHLLQILIEAPYFFQKTGLFLFSVGAALFLGSLVSGLIQVGSVEVGGIHSVLLSLFVGLLGLQFWGIGLIIEAGHKDKNSKLLNVSEDKLFWVASLCAVFSVGLWSWVIGSWIASGFRSISLEYQAVGALGSGLLGFSFIGYWIAAHIIKRFR